MNTEVRADRTRKADRPWRHSLRQRASVIITAALIAAFAVAAPTPAMAADKYSAQTSINSVTADPGNKRIKVVYTNAKSLPSAAVPSAKAFYKETSRGGSLDSKKFSTAKGKHTLYVSTKGALHMVRVEISGVRGIAAKNYTRLVKPGTFTNVRTVTGAEAAANAIAVHVPGAVLTFVPQTRIIRFAGGALLGWTVSSAVKSSLTGSGGKCPKLSKGQVLRTSVTWSQSGDSVSTARTFQVWHSAKDRNGGKAPACTVKSTFSYR